MSKHDWTAMYVMHNALRRELEQLAKVTASTDDDPRRILAVAVGWELFKKSLHIHHTAEDEALWPVMRETLASRPGDLALLDAMEAEHAARLRADRHETGLGAVPKCGGGWGWCDRTVCGWGL